MCCVVFALSLEELALLRLVCYVPERPRPEKCCLSSICKSYPSSMTRRSFLWHLSGRNLVIRDMKASFCAYYPPVDVFFITLFSLLLLEILEAAVVLGRHSFSSSLPLLYYLEDSSASGIRGNCVLCS